MLKISVSHHRRCDRLRACCHEIGPSSRDRRAQLRSSTVYTRCVGDEMPMRATRKTLEDGTIQYLFVDEVDEAPAPDVAEDDSSEGELSETDDGAETEDDTLEDGQRDDELSSMTVKDLKKLCRAHGIKGYSALRKRDLVKLIRAEVQTLDS